jgi:hypothetical protein
LNQFNHFLDRLTKFGIYADLVSAMHAACHKFRAAANEAPVFIAPLDKFRVSRRLLFD